MNCMTKLTAIGLTMTVAAGLFVPLSALADSRQSNKNNWRNLGIGGAAVAGYGLLHHNTTATVLGAAGAAYSANRYEQDRRSQDHNQRARSRAYYRRHHSHYR